MNENQEWKKINGKDFGLFLGDNEYFISNNGDVWSEKSQRILKRSMNNNKQTVAITTKNGKYTETKHLYVHILLYFYFVEKYDKSKYSIGFKDNDSQNVTIENLIKEEKYSGSKETERRNKISLANTGKKRTKRQKRYMSKRKKETITQETRDKISQSRMGANNPKAKKVIKKDLKGKIVEIYDTCRIAEDMNNFARNTLSSKCRMNAQYKGFIWSYK
jgi:hypothetical protein